MTGRALRLKDAPADVGSKIDTARLVCSAFDSIGLGGAGRRRLRRADLIAERGGVEAAELYEVFNMGCGFCCVVPAEHAERAVELLAERHPGSAVIGEATGAGGTVELPLQGLRGTRAEGFRAA